MPENRMKPETLEEVRDRLVQMSEAERRGFDAVSEGQLTPMRENPTDPDGPEQELHELQDSMRLRRSIQDRPDEEAVQQIQESVAAAQNERRAARREGRKAETTRSASAPRRASRKAPADGEKTEE